MRSRSRTCAAPGRKVRLAWALALCLSLTAAVVASSAAKASEAPAPLLLILDASGSMWGQVEGENKIVIARRVVANMIEDLPADQEIGLIAYGHRREGDCQDIETVQAIAPLERGSFKTTVDGLNPKGKTPITASVQQAFDLVAAEERPTTIILVSDGLETCGGDPCAAVRLAREAGSDFLMHVVGFDIAGEDTSSLQCAAQAGGGLFFGADDAQELGDALERAVTMAADVPAGRLAVRGIRNGELHDVGVVVTGADGEMVAGARTYESPETNPSSIPLPDGVFDVTVRAVGIKGAAPREFQIEIRDGETVERTEDFSTGEVRIGITRNGQLSDAVYKIKMAGTNEEAAGGRTYTSARHNPAVVTLTAGDYEVSAASVEIKGGQSVQLGNIRVAPNEPVELSHDFTSGVLEIKVHRGGALADATVQIYSNDGKSIGGARTYTSENRNPATFVLEPGEYRITVQEVRGIKTELNATVAAEATAAIDLDLDQI